jgi:hypothetical protein
MRAITFCALAFVLAGCGDDVMPAPFPDFTFIADMSKPQPVPDMTMAPDMTMPADMAMSMADMTPTNCLTIITCASGCAGNAACQQACAAAGSPTAQQKYQALFACAYAACLPAGDGGMNSDGGMGSCSMLGDMSKACTDCVAAAAQGKMCATQLNDCVMN